ncbi:unnamed protein product, partial [Didymodactylos carnosus]
IPFLLMTLIFCDEQICIILKAASKRDDCSVAYHENFRPNSGIGGGSSIIRFVKHEFFHKNIQPILAKKNCETLWEKVNVKNTKIIGENGENYGNYEDFIQKKCLKYDKMIKLFKTKSQDMLDSFLFAKA